MLENNNAERRIVGIERCFMMVVNIEERQGIMNEMNTVLAVYYGSIEVQEYLSN